MISTVLQNNVMCQWRAAEVNQLCALLTQVRSGNDVEFWPVIREEGVVRDVVDAVHLLDARMPGECSTVPFRILLWVLAFSFAN